MKKTAVETNQKVFCWLHFFLKNFFFYCVWLLMEINAEGPRSDIENESVEIIRAFLLPTEHEYLLVGNQAKTSNGSLYRSVHTHLSSWKGHVSCHSNQISIRHQKLTWKKGVHTQYGAFRLSIRGGIELVTFGQAWFLTQFLLLLSKVGL